MEHLHQHRPPPPNLSHPGIMTVDITDQFAKAVKQLAPGELIKDDHFTLFESVSALEIMDPKMDSGFLHEGESLDEDYDVLRERLPEEILGIIDQLLCLEMAWHLGYPLSQTLLTSVYIEALMNPMPQSIWEADFTRDPVLRDHKPRLHSILRAYCLGLLKSCHYVNETVRDELYYEEEDFVTNTYDRNMLANIPVDSINDLLLAARADLRSFNDIHKDVSAALDLRLELRIAFLRAIHLMSMRDVNPDSLKMPWLQMKGLIEHISKQHGLAKSVPESFSTKLQRKLASTMPPRPIVQPSFEETFDYFKRMFQDGLDIIDILHYSDPQSLMNFVLTFQTRKPQPLIYIRTLLQSLIMKEMRVLGRYSIRQILDHDLQILVLPNGKQLDRAYDNIELPTDPRHQIAAQMEVFRQRVAETYFDVFRILCQNRCRVRRTLCHSIQEWDMLQIDVEEIDQLLQVALEDEPLVVGDGQVLYSLPLSSWSFLYKLRQMEWIVQLGFELDIYQSDELAGMYWYLNYLAKERQHHVERIRTFVERAFLAAGGVKETKQSGSGGYEPSDMRPGKLSDLRYGEFSRSLHFTKVTILDAACTWEFADGLCCLYSVLDRLDLMPMPGSSSSSNKLGKERRKRRPYSDDAHRYEIRMKPFSTIGHPRLPTFDEFTRATTQPDADIHRMLTYADTAINGAKKGFEALSRMSAVQSFSVQSHERWTANMKSCLTSAIAAGVAVGVLRKAMDKAMSEATEEKNDSSGEERSDIVAGDSPEEKTASVPGGEEQIDGAISSEVKNAQAEEVGRKLEGKQEEEGNVADGEKLPDLTGTLRVEIPTPETGYHDWWIVPKIIPIE